MNRQVLGWLWLVIGISLAFITLEVTYNQLLGEILAFLILTINFYSFKRLMYREMITPTASGAIVMSTGVFVSDFFIEFPPAAESFIELGVLIIFVLWLFLIISYTRSVFTGDFFLHYLKGPVAPFGIGTWLAGSSVCSMGLLVYLPLWTPVALFIIFVNSCLWVFFIFLCAFKYLKLFRQDCDLVHGIVLLATVSTQSLVIDYSIILPGGILKTVTLPLLCIGGFFYVMGVAVMIRSYFTHQWRLAEGWKNTNCVLHGALSITGLAITMTGWLSGPILFYFWLLIFVLFILVEATEVVRAYQRVRLFGVKQGLGIYHVSQWARNFTFSMFLAFTLHLPIDVYPSGVLPVMKNLVWGLFVTIIGLLVCQAYLFFKSRIRLENNEMLLQRIYR